MAEGKELQPTGPGKPDRPGQATPVGGEREPSTPPVALTAEEQMALYEKELKEDDWGHQPC